LIVVAHAASILLFGGSPEVGCLRALVVNMSAPLSERYATCRECTPS
jgi:hypothetical protein